MTLTRVALAAATLATLAACSPSYNQRTYPMLPDALKDCQFFDIRGENGNGYMSVARCPNSTTSTTYQTGKTTNTTVVIDGVEYAKKEN